MEGHWDLYSSKIEMTATSIIAAFHSLVGLAAVFVATSAFYAPESYGIVAENGKIFTSSLIEMSIGVAIAITYRIYNSIFKTSRLVSGAPTTFLVSIFLIS